MQSTTEALRSFHSSNLSSLQYQIDKRDELILRAEPKLTAIGSYLDQLEERLASFAVTRRDMAVREDRCDHSELETPHLGGEIDALKVVVTKVNGERNDIKGLIEMMTRG